MKNKERGITLVALVVTIIILLILAGVTLGIVFGNTGLFERTKKAAEIYQKKENEEEELIKNLEKDIDVYKGDNLVFTQEPTEWTKEKVTVTIENKLQWCKLEYLKDEETGEWEEYTDKIEVDTNKKIYARLVDGEKVIEYGAISIENIDNENPEVGEVIMRVGSKTGKLYKGDVVIQENLYLSMQEGKDNESP